MAFQLAPLTQPALTLARNGATLGQVAPVVAAGRMSDAAATVARNSVTPFKAYGFFQLAMSGSTLITPATTVGYAN